MQRKVEGDRVIPRPWIESRTEQNEGMEFQQILDKHLCLPSNFYPR